MIRFISHAGLLAGLLALALLIAWQGAGGIFALLRDSGPWLLLLPLTWAPVSVVAVLSWRLLFPRERIPPGRELLLALWMGRAINSLLPVATIGGEIARARLLLLWGRDGVEASASVMVDKTVQALAMIPWAIIGAGLLLRVAMDDELAALVVLGALLLALGILGFVLAQRAGIFAFGARLIGKFTAADGWPEITANARAVDDRIKAIYAAKKRLLGAVALRTGGLILETGEVWLACYLLGQPLSLIEALLLKSLTSVITDIAFVIPNGYGIQEGGYLLFGALLGLTPEFALAVSLATRIKEFVIDLPGLFYWQRVEAKYLLKKSGKGGQTAGHG